MTKEEEAIKYFQGKIEWAKQKCYPYISKGEVEIFETAIEALKQEPFSRIEYGTDGNVYRLSISNGKEFEQNPCEDVISRQAVLDKWEQLSARGRTEFDQVLMTMPSTKPQEPKTGHWILADSQDNVDVENGNNRYICSECTFSDIHAKSTEVPYCWHCGARMESEI